MSDRRFWHRLRLSAGPTAVAVSGPVSQQERLDGQEAFAATVRVAGTPTATIGAAVDLALVDLAEAEGKWQLVGILDAKDATSHPHEQVWTITDVMAEARRARESDLDLTGMTDGEAVEAALTFAGIAFDGADIQDAGYVLGEKTDVAWLADRTAGDLIAELDSLFQMRTFSLDDGRVIRKRYTLWPSTADAVAAYDRGNATVEPYLFGAARSRGRFDDVRNAVRVEGASYECGDDGKCRCRVWARAEADHPSLGSGVRTRPIVVTSDFIQSTGLAEAIAADRMKGNNRLRDRVRVTTENDPNVTIGKVVKVRDQAAGIDLASYSAYTVVFVDRLGNRMVLEAVGGAAGAVGTVTSGIEQVCNQTTFPLPEVPDFTMPGFGTFPSVPAFAIGDLPGAGGEFVPPDNEEGGGGGGGETDLIAGHLPDWTTDFGSTSTGGGDVRCQAGGGGHFTTLDLPDDEDWEIVGTIELETSDSEAELAIARDASFAEVLLFVAADFDTECRAPEGFDAALPQFAAGDVEFTITHDHAAETTRFQVSQSGGPSIDETFGHETHPEPQRYVCFDAAGDACRLKACVVTVG